MTQTLNSSTTLGSVLQDRTAFVTGGAGGIGSEVCRALANLGAKVVVTDLSGVASKSLADEFDGIAFEMDITDPSSVEAVTQSAEKELGRIDILVNCAGWDEFKPFLRTDEAFTSRILEINLAGPIRVTRQLLRGMVERKYGRVINIASDAGRVGSSLEAVYSGAKGGVIAFTKTIARECARVGVTANVVSPGPTDTPLLATIIGSSRDASKVIAAMTDAVPMRRLGTPIDVAPAVAFLATDQAGFITGQVLSVSGGLTMC